MGQIVGIDLGTTNSVVGVIDAGRPIVIANSEGSRTTPSIVGFTKDKEIVIGDQARRQLVLNPKNTFYNLKRFIGSDWDELDENSISVPYNVKANTNGSVRVLSPNTEREYAPEELVSSLIRKLINDAETYLGDTVDSAVITVPAYFNESQRQATKDSAILAGIKVDRILNEPTAAALAYGFEKSSSNNVLVFDLGGGTFDVSLLKISNGVFDVKATCGDTQLGGNNFDSKIVDWLAEKFLAKYEIDLRRDRQALQRLTEAAEKAKIELSNATQSEINLPFITATPEGPKHLDLNLTRAKFEELAASLIDRCKTPVERAISDAKISTSEIDEVVMVGGSSRIPAVLDLVKKIIGKEPNQTVNPDEVVAVGAAIQGGVLAGEVKDILLLDVTPLSLGVETLGGVMTKMINRNTTVPTKKSETYSTAVDGQTNVEIHVLQGEREMASDNKSLGTFRLDGIPSAPRGVPQIEVTFDIDANGILSVTAKDKGSGKEQSISITGASTLSDNEVEKMVKDAESNASSDKEKREKIDLKNQAETLVYQTEKQLGELGDKLDASAKSKVEEKSNALKEATSKEDYESMKKLLEELQQELYAVGSSVYQQPGNQPPSPGAQGGPDQSDSNEKGGDDVIDADFTETKD